MEGRKVRFLLAARNDTGLSDPELRRRFPDAVAALDSLVGGRIFLSDIGHLCYEPPSGDERWVWVPGEGWED